MRRDGREGTGKSSSQATTHKILINL